MAVKATVIPVATYGSTVWYSPGKGNYLVGRVDKTLHAALRRALPVWKTTPNSALHRESAIPPTDILLTGLSHSAQCRATRHMTCNQPHPLAGRPPSFPPKPGFSAQAEAAAWWETNRPPKYARVPWHIPTKKRRTPWFPRAWKHAEVVEIPKPGKPPCARKTAKGWRPMALARGAFPPRRTLHTLVADRTGHGHFASYHRRFAHESAPAGATSSPTMTGCKWVGHLVPEGGDHDFGMPAGRVPRIATVPARTGGDEGRDRAHTRKEAVNVNAMYGPRRPTRGASRKRWATLT